MTTPERSQYHHFIPRLILRGFAEDVQLPAGPAAMSKQQLKKKQRRDALLNLVNTDDGSVIQRPLSRQYGLTDMYRDQRAEQQHGLEVKLSRLEAQVGEILARARSTFSQAGDLRLTLSRSEKDALRKFLFLMKYRSSHMYSRFNVETIEEYAADDKDKMSAYMNEKGYSSPRDVWLANLHAFLDVDIDTANKWQRTLQQVAFGDDAKLFILHVAQSFVAFCKPKSSHDEFMLTENAFGIFEGPSNQAINVLTGERERGTWTEWHNFAPISASLLIVLRSNYLPGGVADASEELRDRMYRAMLNMNLDPKTATSMLQDLPVTKCENSYSTVRNGRVTSGAGFTDYGPTDQFTFRCFELDHNHVNVINGLFLEEGVGTSAFTYKNGAAAAKAIKQYLEDPWPGMKVVESDDSPRARYLTALKNGLKQLGGTARVVFKRLMLPTMTTLPLDYGNHMARWVGLSVATEIFYESPRLLGYYEALAGGVDRAQYMYDAEQACKLCFLRIKMDTVMANVPPDAPDKIRVKEVRQDFYTTLPAQRIWLYVKVSRNLPNFDLADFTRQLRPLELDGPEDIVVHHMSGKPDPGTSGRIFYAALMGEDL